jgi:hypothetical protein
MLLIEWNDNNEEKIILEPVTFSYSMYFEFKNYFINTTDLIMKKRYSIYDKPKKIIKANDILLSQLKSVEDNNIINLSEYIIQETLDIGLYDKFIKINCSQTKLNKIICSNPNIKLLELNCIKNNLLELDNIKLNNLVKLFCGYNKISKLDNLPSSLKYLDCAGNSISMLSNLPDKLVYLNCENCKINNLDNLPLTLEILICSDNYILSLDYLPESIVELNCKGCRITQLDNLPSNICELTCYSNKIYELFNLPKNIYLIKCDENLHLLNYPNDLEQRVF